MQRAAETEGDQNALLTLKPKSGSLQHMAQRIPANGLEKSWPQLELYFTREANDPLGNVIGT